jgi:hypothetical protein
MTEVTPNRFRRVDRVDQRAHLLIEGGLRDHGLQRDEGEGVAVDDARVLPLGRPSRTRCREVGKPVGADAECFHRLLVQEGAVVGVLHDQGPVRHRLRSSSMVGKRFSSNW